jgi:nucleolar complex protein 3
VRQIFNGDGNFDVSPELVLEMTKLIKAKNYKVTEEMINCFLSLRVRESLTRRAFEDAATKETAARALHKKKKQQPHQSRSQKKEFKAAKELSKELRELEGEANERQLATKQSDILKSIFATYFRVIKNAPQSPLMPAVLEVLSVYIRFVFVFGDDACST